MGNENMNDLSMTEIFESDDIKTAPVSPMGQAMMQGQPPQGQPMPQGMGMPPMGQPMMQGQPVPPQGQGMPPMGQPMMQGQPPMGQPVPPQGQGMPMGQPMMQGQPVPPQGQGMPPMGQPQGQPPMGQPVPPQGQPMPQGMGMPPMGQPQGQPPQGQPMLPQGQGMPMGQPMPQGMGMPPMGQPQGQPPMGQPVPPQGTPMGQPQGQPAEQQGLGGDVPPMPQGMPMGQPAEQQGFGGDMPPVETQPHVKEKKRKDKKEKKNKNKGEAPVDGTNNGAGKEKTKNSVAGIIIAIASVIVILVGAGLIVYSLITKNQYNTEDFADKNTELETEIKDVESFQGINDTTSSTATSWVYGCRNDIAEDDNFYYIPDYKNNYKLCKVSKSDYSKTVIVDMSASSVNVIDDKIYFRNHFADTSDDNGIYSVNTDGSDLECILPGTYTTMTVVNDWIYYISGYDYNLYKINIFGRNIVKLVSDHVSDMDVFENTIYYSTYDENRNKRDSYRIAAIDVDGNNKVQYTDYVEYYSIEYSDGYIYYADGDDCLGRIDTFSTENEKLCDCKTDLNISVLGDKVYFIDNEKDISLAVYSISDGSIKHYNVKNVDTFYVGENTLITLYMDSSFNPVVSANDINTGAVIDLFK